eukprot:TRINITY_DN55407_c0_g1_i1.p1 TRINITY_DN55407_c0_g1~~TRINITY_DN55407_c0_g1_i1.p1  ORF type:complete len:347 (-),score=44.65 TRINITY_DN55407_c0_g1_i1:375-1280(-)
MAGFVWMSSTRIPALLRARLKTKRVWNVARGLKTGIGYTVSSRTAACVATSAARELSGDEARPSRRIAIYGGAFDPITNSHLTCASEIVHSGCADECWLVPCGPRPDKPKLKTSSMDRYAMCQVAVNTTFSPNFPVRVSDVDTNRDQAAYTYDLLTHLQSRYPSYTFVFVIGSDWLQADTNIASWPSLNKSWSPGMPEAEKEIVTGDKLLKEFDFLVIKRPGYEVDPTDEDPSGLEKFGPRLNWLKMPTGMTFIEGNLSSTEIRKRTETAWQNGDSNLSSVEGLVPLGILAFIKRHKLYKK